MGGLCNCATGFINSCCLILSIPFLLAGYIMKLTANSPCDPILYKPLLGIGVFLFALSLLGILASCCGCTIFLWLYLSIVFVMIVVVSFTMVFGATVVKGGAGELIAGTPYREYRLEDFSSWLKNRIVDDEHWGNIRSCMIRHDACGKYQAYRSLVDLVQINSTKLTAIEGAASRQLTVDSSTRLRPAGKNPRRREQGRREIRTAGYGATSKKSCAMTVAPAKLGIWLCSSSTGKSSPPSTSSSSSSSSSFLLSAAVLSAFKSEVSTDNLKLDKLHESMAQMVTFISAIFMLSSY
ncbi:hypothetical protein Nepgr_005619 [Nepenthes gracilis]|uniref:Uncharacterized protein n=1 Tax=Nepenthes gracilis TaxID=150966 RepID=A0AAD3XGL7_NEPGR|nr:hypothetical protein Nepgr_005619 [Nepenthes gracilis]